MPRLDGMALPEDWRDGCFAARVMTKEGPSAVAVLRGAAFDMTPAFGTASAWLNERRPDRRDPRPRRADADRPAGGAGQQRA